MEITHNDLAQLQLKDKRRREQLEGNRGSNLQSLGNRHHEMLRLKALGLSNVKIAEKLGVHKQTVTHCVNSPVGNMQLDLIRGTRDNDTLDMLDQIKAVLPEALKVMKNTLNGGTLEDEYLMRKLQLGTATNLFEMAGMGPIKRTDSRNVSARVTGDDIKALVREADMHGSGEDGFIVDD